MEVDLIIFTLQNRCCMVCWIPCSKMCIRDSLQIEKQILHVCIGQGCVFSVKTDGLYDCLLYTSVPQAARSLDN